MKSTASIVAMLYLGFAFSAHAQQSRDVEQLNSRMDSLEGSLIF